MALRRNDFPIPHDPKMPMVNGGFVSGASMRSANAFT